MPLHQGLERREGKKGQNSAVAISLKGGAMAMQILLGGGQVPSFSQVRVSALHGQKTGQPMGKRVIKVDLRVTPTQLEIYLH